MRIAACFIIYTLLSLLASWYYLRLCAISRRHRSGTGETGHQPEAKPERRRRPFPPPVPHLLSDFD